MKASLSFLAVVAATTLTCSALAQPSDLDHSDRAFLEKAAKSGAKEVAVSEAVQSQLTLPDARNFVQMMVTDHTKANEELKALAAKKGVTLPAESPKFAKKWSEKNKDADHDYLKEMVDDHEEAVKLFEKAAKSKDADIAAFAEKTLPTLRHHLELAKSNKAALPR
jgi:putative membrane protein